MALLKDILLGMPDSALERIVWLDELQQLVTAEINAELQVAYFNARMQGQINSALALAPHARKTVIAMTRAENEARGRAVRWNDEFVKQQRRKSVA